MIRVVESPSAAVRLEAARVFVASLSPASGALVVGASREAADDLVRRATSASGATFGLHRASLTQLAARLAAAHLARAGAAPTSALGSEALAARVTFEALAAGALRYFSPVARFPGFARALASTLAELRLARVAPEALRALGRSGADMGELLVRLEEALRVAALSDRTALFELAATAVTRGARVPEGRVPMVFLDVSIGSPAEQAFVGALAADSPSVLATVPAGDDITLRAVLALGGERAAPGRGNGPRMGKAMGPPPPIPADLAALGSRHGAGAHASGVPGEGDASPSSGLGQLWTYVFSETAPAQAAAPGDVVFFSAPGEGREAVEIARQILEEARRGTPFDGIAVLLRSPQAYSALLETALSRAGIPAFFARGARRPDPAGRAFLALLDCGLERFSARRFAEYLSLGHVPPVDAEGAPPRDRQLWVAAEDEALGLGIEPVPAEGDAARPESSDGPGGAGSARSEEPPRSGDAGRADPEDSDADAVVEGTLRAPWKWEKLLVDSAVIGGRERWSRRIAGLDAELHLRLDELREEEPDSPRLAGIERDLANLEHLRRFALPVIDQLAALPARGSWGEWIEALERLAPMVLRRPERVLGVLAALRPLGPIGPVGLDEVRDVLAEEMATLSERPPAARYGRVFVGTVEQARGRAFDVVFLPGLTERMFPRKPREDPMLLDALRRQLGAELMTQGDRAQHERLLLRLAVGAATRRLYLSYSRIDLAQARPRVPSFYALELRRALSGRIPDPQTLERDAAAASGARLAWPAPDDPARAIDEVEHDLGSLGALVRQRGAETKGRARYLLELNEGLARSLRTRWARWRRPWTPYDGIVRVADGTRNALLASRPTARAYSVSALQRFAACPYQFFLSAIWRLAPREEIAPLERLDPLTRGKLFHQVQAESLRTLQQAGLLPLSGEALELATARLDDTLARVAGEYRERLAPAIARVWQDEVESLRIDLRTWLERSVEDQARWEPFAFELAFGLPGGLDVDPRSVRAEVVLAGGWRLRGIVDLVERRRGGHGLRVTDSKTGANRTATSLVVGKGETLQPVLYGLAVEQILGEPVAESRLSFCTRAGGFSERVVPMAAAARRRGLDVLDVIDRHVARGFLPPAPRPKACMVCDFRPVCGPHEEVRVEQKDRAALEDLRTLRSWP